MTVTRYYPTDRAVTLAEALIRALGLTAGITGWEDAVDAAVCWVNENIATDELFTSTDEVLLIVAERNHLDDRDRSR